MAKNAKILIQNSSCLGLTYPKGVGDPKHEELWVNRLALLAVSNYRF